MSKHNQFKRRALLLFLIVSLAPAMTVSALWYIYTRNIAGGSFINFGSFVVPIALLGLMPAIILAIIFAEVLAIPIRHLQEGVARIAKGDFSFRVKSSKFSEFYETSELLNQISLNLQQTLSQKDSENDLIAAERNKLRGVLNNMSDGVLALDKSNRIIMFNRAAAHLTDRSIEMVAGRPLGDVMPFYKDGKSIVLNWLLDQPVGSDNVQHWTDIELECRDKSVLRVDAEAILLPNDPNGIRMLMTFHDLTRPRELEDMEINFVSLAAHELRTPITTVKGYLDILNSEIGSKLTAEQKGFLSRSQVGIEQLSSLVNNLLNVSRIEQGKLTYDFEETDWLAFMRQLEVDLNHRMMHEEHRIVMHLPKRLPKVAMDHMAISEIFYNLVDNAVHHSQNTGIITISCKQTHDGIETTVSDTGVGIPKEALGRLFQKFYRVAGMKSTTSGTGLGLYICKQIAEAHRGYMWVESEVGRGTTFGLNLPLASKLGTKLLKGNKSDTKLIRGAHGWIKKNSHS